MLAIVCHRHQLDRVDQGLENTKLVSAALGEVACLLVALGGSAYVAEHQLALAEADKGACVLGRLQIPGVVQHADHPGASFDHCSVHPPGLTTAGCQAKRKLGLAGVQ